jgi:hypothetical protein
MGASFRYSLESMGFLRGYPHLCASAQPLAWASGCFLYRSRAGQFNLKEVAFGMLAL